MWRVWRALGARHMSCFPNYKNRPLKWRRPTRLRTVARHWAAVHDPDGGAGCCDLWRRFRLRLCVAASSRTGKFYLHIRPLSEEPLAGRRRPYNEGAASRASETIAYVVVIVASRSATKQQRSGFAMLFNSDTDNICMCGCAPAVR